MPTLQEIDYREALALNPQHIETRLTYARFLQNAHRPAEAEALLREGLALRPESVSLCRLLAETLAAEGRYDEAIEHGRSLMLSLRNGVEFRVAYAAWLMQAGAGDPGGQKARQNLKQLWDELNSAEKTIADALAAEAKSRDGLLPLPPPDNLYVASLFDFYAESFDDDMVQLGYRGPQHLMQAIDKVGGAKMNLDIVDVGCGTGAAAPLLRPLARRLIGIDLAPRMLARAKQLDLYDELIHADMRDWMAGRHAEADLILAADMLIYCDALETVFERIATMLRPGGIFAATAEKPDGAEDYVIQKSRRYAHSENHIRKMAAAASLDVAIMEQIPLLRREGKQEIPGLIFVLTK